MSHIKTSVLLGIGVLAAVPVSSAWAGHSAYRHYRMHGQSAYSSPAFGRVPDSPGAIIARKTAEAQDEPGLTRELAPDSRQTATGGPAGGVPGFSGD